MALPASFIQHLRQEGYHPRSDKHSKALARAIVADLGRYCDRIASDAQAAKLVWEYNHDLTYGHATWNTDLAIGQPPPGSLPAPVQLVGPMRRATPASTRIAVEIKGVMTEHRKAVKNRKRDLESHHAHVHDYDPQAIAAGIVVVNAAPMFASPLRAAGQITVHRDPEALVQHCINELNNVTMASGAHRVGLDAKCALVVSMDNVDLAATTYWTAPPAPQVGSPIHWDAFMQRICTVYGGRFPTAS
ncbi:MAG TPA: hypothetical protein VG452_02440 [Egibacteraceae bacterium]|nr:hypothetical protein [Actinomycetota bacterium]HWB71048.1 hypothetical protein [Egibacteraceae bacterium]